MSYVPRPPDIESQHLSDDLLAVMRWMNRLRGELITRHAWLHVEAACLELAKARIQLKRGDGPQD